MPTVFADIAELRAGVGSSLGDSDWLEITQKRIDTFADATGDHQWIHVDPERAKDGPFGTTIAHGYLTLSLVASMFQDVLAVTSVHTMVNYGLGKVRFPAPVPVDSRVRLSAVLQAVDDVAGGAQVTLAVTMVRDGGEKPVCVAEMIFRVYE